MGVALSLNLDLGHLMESIELELTSSERFDDLLAWETQRLSWFKNNFSQFELNDLPKPKGTTCKNNQLNFELII